MGEQLIKNKSKLIFWTNHIYNIHFSYFSFLFNSIISPLCVYLCTVPLKTDKNQKCCLSSLENEQKYEAENKKELNGDEQKIQQEL